MKYELIALGTPLMDIFCKADYSFLEKNGLVPGCTNHLSDAQVARIAKGLKPIYQTPGDNARNVCEAYAKSGGTACAYIGNVGADAVGNKIRENLKKNGICDLMQEAEGNTGRIICIITPDKQRTFAVYLGVGDGQTKIGKFESSEIFFCTSITLLGDKIGKSAFGIAQEYRRNGSKIAISLESPNLLEKNISRMEEIFSLADYLFLNEDEMTAIGRNRNTIGAVSKIVFLKRGERGCAVYNEGRLLGNVPAKEVEEVKDTTGAGDFFAGAVLHALAHGRSLLEAAHVGNEMAAKVIANVGAQV